MGDEKHDLGACEEAETELIFLRGESARREKAFKALQEERDELEKACNALRSERNQIERELKVQRDSTRHEGAAAKRDLEVLQQSVLKLQGPAGLSPTNPAASSLVPMLARRFLELEKIVDEQAARAKAAEQRAHDLSIALDTVRAPAGDEDVVAEFAQSLSETRRLVLSLAEQVEIQGLEEEPLPAILRAISHKVVGWRDSLKNVFGHLPHPPRLRGSDYCQCGHPRQDHTDNSLWSCRDCLCCGTFTPHPVPIVLKDVQLPICDRGEVFWSVEQGPGQAVCTGPCQQVRYVVRYHQIKASLDDDGLALWDRPVCGSCLAGVRVRPPYHVGGQIDVEPPTSSVVNHPAHYGGDSVYETIKVIEAWSLGFCLGNAVKYIARAGKKPGAPTHQDLEKARWYLDREIQRVKGCEK